MPHRPPRVVIVDPRPLVRWSLGQIAERRCHLALAGEAASVGEAVAAVFVLKPDVIIIDDSVVGEDAWHLAAHLRACHPDLGIVMVSADGSTDAVRRAMDVGASAIVGRAAPVTDVVAAVRGAAVAPASFTAPALGAAMRQRRDADGQPPLRDHERSMLLQSR